MRSFFVKIITEFFILCTRIGTQNKCQKYGMHFFATQVLSSRLAGFFHLVEETGLNPGLNRPGRNRFLPTEVEETGKKFEMHD